MTATLAALDSWLPIIGRVTALRLSDLNSILSFNLFRVTGMAIFPYASNASRLKDIFKRVQDVGVPSKVTNKYLESLGFKSKNDRAIVGILRTLGFIDASGVPTDVWRQYRNKTQSKAVMATVLKTTYSGLFATYPDAYRRDNEALRNYFSSHTTVGEGGLRFMVATFKALSELADFGANEMNFESGDDESDAVEDGPHSLSGTLARRRINGSAGLSVSINIQLQIPETEKAEVYDKFFEAMKKHLFS